MNLGDIIKELECCPDNYNVYFDFGGTPTGLVNSYRGDYSQLAIAYGNQPCRAGDLRTTLCRTVNKTFEGYKGGTYRMDISTPVWAANWGEYSRLSIVRVYRGAGVWLYTEEQEW